MEDVYATTILLLSVMFLICSAFLPFVSYLGALAGHHLIYGPGHSKQGQNSFALVVVVFGIHESGSQVSARPGMGMLADMDDIPRQLREFRVQDRRARTSKVAFA